MLRYDDNNINDKTLLLLFQVGSHYYSVFFGRRKKNPTTMLN
jgi:hypothetical protein